MKCYLYSIINVATDLDCGASSEEPSFIMIATSIYKDLSQDILLLFNRYPKVSRLPFALLVRLFVAFTKSS